jgi:hypothetical protein
MKELGQRIDYGPGTRFDQRLNDTRKCGRGLSPSSILRAVRHFAGNHRRAQRPFRAIVGRLDPRVCQETQEVAPIVDRDASRVD